MTTPSTWLAGVALPCAAPAWTDRSLRAFSGRSEGDALSPDLAMTRDARRAPIDPVGLPAAEAR